MALLALLSLAAPHSLVAWSNPLFPRERQEVAEPQSELDLESAGITVTEAGTISAEPSEKTQSSPVGESKTLVGALADTGKETVKVKADDLRQIDSALAYADNTIGLLTADNDRMAQEIAKLDRELARWHFGIGFGAQANMDSDFGAAVYATARKGSFLVLTGVGYIPLDKDFEKDRLNYQVGVVYEF